MKATEPAKAFGAVIGKALAALGEGRGLIPSSSPCSSARRRGQREETRAMTALTIPELAAICLGPDKSPWPLKDLLGLYKVKTLSLRSLVTKVSEAKAIYYVEVRGS